jgi:hypothetical protein
MPEIGKPIRVRLDREHVFVFPATAAPGAP